ncbi:phosphotransferase [Oceaniglobus roseus]|uniref:phosphotransferase n=1 Tax=Oceaniglobus roseus TaxID=1737570 RepID=UPI000C7F1641|nr:phosphotransferase [Kandeliimicrobium roseum]
MSDGMVSGPEALGAWLEAEVPEVGRVLRIVKFDGGQSNPTYRVEGTGRTLVLRTKPPGRLLKSAHMVEREFRVMAALEGSAVAVPRVLKLVEDGQPPLGRAFFVMEHLDGRIFWDPALPDVEPHRRWEIYDAMNSTLAALHRVDPQAAGLGDFGRPGDYFARQTARWTSQYHASCESPSDDMLALIGWLEDNQPGDDGQVALVHGDYRLDNLVFDPVGPEVIGVLDWELSTLGHPLADLAYQCMQWRLPHAGGMRGLGGIDRAAQGLPDEAEYVAAYCRRRGLPGIEGWTFFLAFSFFRLAAILEGVVARARSGNASNPEKARAYAASIPVLAAMAVDLTRKGAA